MWAQRIWFYCEMYFLLSIAMTFTIFLMLRSLTKNKLFPEDFAGLGSYPPDMETVLALERLEISFLNSVCPAIMTIMILLTPNNAHSDHKEDLMIQLYLMVGEAVFCSLGVPFMIFVSWRHGSACWKKTAPCLYLFLTICIWFIIPITCFFYNLYLWTATTDQHGSIYSAWTVAFMVIQLGNMC